MTYSIVARDAATGHMGVAVQSHWFSVGPIVPWGHAGVGVVATQALAEPAYGPKGLAAMAGGSSAAEALAAALDDDDNPDVRQVAMVDANGTVAAHTGDRCITEAGHTTGDGFSCQANMMLRATVWPAMADAFVAADGDLAARLMAALLAAEDQGGDIRGRQSAALLIVSAQDTGKPWDDVVMDLRVDDHPTPLIELDRLLTIQRAYDHMNAFDRRMDAGDIDGAWRELEAAEGHTPTNVELKFWKAVALADQGREVEARAALAPVYAVNPNWAELFRRLPAAGLTVADPAMIERLTTLP
jgi:uncharacterized Ntn-hydrolase superfamily protein